MKSRLKALQLLLSMLTHLPNIKNRKWWSPVARRKCLANAKWELKAQKSKICLLKVSSTCWAWQRGPGKSGKGVSCDEINVIIHSAVAVALFDVALRDLLPKLNLVFFSFCSPLLLLVTVHLLLHLGLSNKCLSSNRYESLLDVLVLACGRLNKVYVSILRAPFFRGLDTHAPRLFFEINFVANQHEGKILRLLHHTFLKETLLPVR